MRNIQNIENIENKILYYPTIKIEDGAWLRNALLYWDKISSIVPGVNYNESNSAEIEYLWNKGLYEPTYPIDLENDKQLCKEFCEQIRKRLRRSRRFSANRKSSQIHTEKMPNRNMVHINKTPGTILDYLLYEGIAKKSCDGPWIDMNEDAANIYMAILAKYLARIHENTEIGTDNSGKFLYPYIPERSMARRKIDKQAYLNLVMEEILPMPNKNIPIEDIVDFKSQYRKQLKCFKHRIDEFQWDLRTCENVEEMQERMQMFRREIENDLDEIEELMASNRIRKMKKALRIVIPVGLEAVISTLGLKGMISPMHSIFLTAAVGISAGVFCTEKESQVADDRAYLFYARENGIIMR